MAAIGPTSGVKPSTVSSTATIEEKPSASGTPPSSSFEDNDPRNATKGSKLKTADQAVRDGARAKSLEKKSGVEPPSSDSKATKKKPSEAGADSSKSPGPTYDAGAKLGELGYHFTEQLPEVANLGNKARSLVDATNDLSKGQLVASAVMTKANIVGNTYVLVTRSGEVASKIEKAVQTKTADDIHDAADGSITVTKAGLYATKGALNLAKMGGREVGGYIPGVSALIAGADLINVVETATDKRATWTDVGYAAATATGSTIAAIGAHMNLAIPGSGVAVSALGNRIAAASIVAGMVHQGANALAGK